MVDGAGVQDALPGGVSQGKNSPRSAKDKSLKVPGLESISRSRDLTAQGFILPHHDKISQFFHYTLPIAKKRLKRRPERGQWLTIRNDIECAVDIFSFVVYTSCVSKSDRFRCIFVTIFLMHVLSVGVHLCCCVRDRDS